MGRMAGEREFVLIFAALLMGGSLLILTLPLLRHMMGDRGWSVLGLFGLPALGFALAGVTIAGTLNGDPLLLAPIVAAVAALRCLSPTLTFLKVQEKFEPKQLWYWVKAVLVVAFLAMPAYLVYRLLVPPDPTDALILGERTAMALGTAMVLIRFYMLLLPKLEEGRLYLLASAILFSVALGVVAPYAFPGYGFYYALSGIAGWLLGLFFILRSV